MRIVIKGDGFEQGERGDLIWEDTEEPFTTFKASVRGGFAVRTRVPRDLKPGEYVLLAVGKDGSRRAAATITVAVAKPDRHPGSDARTDPESDTEAHP